MSDIYKVCELNDSNNISKITVFYGNTDLDIQTLFLENPSNSIFENVFSKSELDNISTNNIPVEFTSLSIYSDDTIQNIKKKLLVLTLILLPLKKCIYSQNKFKMLIIFLFMMP